MTVIAVLRGADNLTVEPGQSASCELSLSNTGSIVEQFAVMVLGDGAEWITAEPPVVSMFPGAQQTLTLRFRPPRAHTTPAGPVPFAVKVIPSNEPDSSITEEGIVTVGTFNDVGAELLPRVVSGRVTGRQRLAVDSRGNLPLPVEVTARDSADAVKFRIRPAALTTVPGNAHFVRIHIKPRKRFFKGPAQLRQYQVQVDAAGEKPLVLEGQFKQSALIPKWVFALAGLLVTAALLWYFVLRPAIRDEAQNANKQALAAQAAQTQALQGQVKAAQQQASSASAAAAAASAAAGKSGGATTTTSSTTSTTVKKSVVPTASSTTTTTTTTAAPPSNPPVTGPADNTLQVITAPGSTGTAPSAAVGSGTYMNVTDLVITNVSGSSGIARIERVVPSSSPGGTATTQDLLIENLADLTSQEYTFSTPIVFTHGQQIQLRVDCSGDQTACDVAVYYNGPETQPSSATTTTLPG
jgi:hypothetical protein